MFRLYIANLAKYNEGRLVGKWVDLPMCEDELQEKIQEILGNDEECAIHDYENDYGVRVSEYDSPFELNEVAEKLEEYDEDTVKALSDIFADIHEVIRVMEDGDFISLHGVRNEEDLGYEAIEELGMMEIPENLKIYFDYEKFGRDLTCDGWTIFPEQELAVRTF